ncbi:MAG TPA: SurA N-terminal domain-containing protein [Rhizomicrobium sp.]|jgi:peptidyl-prolyl cis-trans isomerase D|nr:SurA N-terminal domain-containing protein [Rhizomicrobium sp.]
MIQWLHALSKSWMATLLMGGLTLSFLVWGIADVFTGVSSSGVASVGSTDIGRQEFQRLYRNFVRNQSQQMGTEITPDMAQKMGLPQVALQQLISRTALDNEAVRLGLTTPDAELAQNVRAMAAFRGPLGTFDRPTFMQALQTAQYSEDQFLAEVRQDLTRDQLTQAVEGNFVVPPTYAQALFQYLNEKRAVDYVILSPDQAGDVAPPSDTVLAAYVKAHPERYSTPEYRDADYAVITPADVMGSVTVSDAQISQEYDAHKATYVVPEKRDIQQIEFKTGKDAASARAQIDKGMSFDELAARQGLKPDQISLGTLTQADLPDPDRAKAVFALPENQVSQPLKTALGSYVLVRVTKITPGSNKTLADVKDDIKKALTTALAANKLVDAVNAYTDARSGGSDLKEAAQKSGMKIGHLTAVDANGLNPDGGKVDMPADAEFLPTLFKTEMGEDSDPAPTKAGDYFVVHVNGITPPKLKPVDQVRAQAIADWTNEQRGKLLAAKALALTDQAEKDKSLDKVAKEMKLTVQHSPALTRQTNDTMFSAAFVQRLFMAEPGGVVSGAQGLSGNYILARVTGIAHPKLDPRDPSFQAGAARLSQALAGDFSIAMANAARERQGVKVNQKMVASLTGNQ